MAASADPRVDYRNWESISNAFARTCPHLALVSTESEWEAAVTAAKRPDRALVTVRNADGELRTCQIRHLHSGNTIHQTESERNAFYKSRSIKGDVSRMEREEEAVRLVSAMCGLPLQSTHALGMESTSADAFFGEGDACIGLQMTRANYNSFSGTATIDKSTADFLKMLGLGFAFVLAIFSNGVFCGAYLWLPSDSSVFSTGKEFSKFRVSPFFKHTPKKDTVRERMLPYLFLWHPSAGVVHEEAKRNFVAKLVAFAKDPATRRYAVDEIASHLFPSKLKEKMYLENFQTLLDDDVTYRRVVLRKGDAALVLPGGTEAMVEFKMACRDCQQFKVEFRKAKCAPWDLNEVSVFAMAVLAADGLAEEEKTTRRDVYKYFILLPTRTSSGEPNIRFDDPLATTFRFKFHRGTLEFSHRTVRDTRALVLVAGEGGRRFDAAAQETVAGWVQRPRVDMKTLVDRWYTERRDTEHAAKRRRVSE